MNQQTDWKFSNTSCSIVLIIKEDYAEIKRKDNNLNGPYQVQR